ncbi:MAG TPA: hypothetical protein VEA41_09075 [Salinarimonas sp.]|nr:hypothetical protein [Salinarimonas sp.]
MTVLAPLRLYWITTPANQDDWFLIARSAEDAVEHVVDEYGYYELEGHAEATHAREIAILPPGLQCVQKAIYVPGDTPRSGQLEELVRGVGLPRFEILEACGLFIVHAREPYVLLSLDKDRLFVQGINHYKVAHDPIMADEGHPPSPRRSWKPYHQHEREWSSGGAADDGTLH